MGVKMLEINTRRKFVKDFGLTVPVLEDPYFDYIIKQINAEEKLQLLLDEISLHGTEQNFFGHIKQITEKIVADIDVSSLEQDSLSKYKVDKPNEQTNVYNKNNNGRNVISIDLVKANYQALKEFNPSLVQNSKNYEEFIKIYTDSVYMAKSRHIRQYMFGNLAPKRQTHIWKWIMYQTSMMLRDYEIFAVSSDEIVIYDETNISNIEKILSYFPWDFKIRKFVLEQIHDYDYYRRIFPDGTYDFKQVPIQYIMQFIKHYKNEEINEMDLTFTHESGRLARFIEPLCFN